MLKNFLAYNLALELYRHCESIRAKHHIKDQLLRASLSIVTNLAEGSGKPTAADQRRFYGIALGSLRETQALLTVLDHTASLPVVDRLGGMVYRLVHPR